ncbi:MAG: GNAT family N-acetyltransferase [Rhizobiaceae bacterium]
MVDAEGAILPKADSGLRLSPVIHYGGDAADVHATVCRTAVSAPAQHPLWVETRMAQSGADTLVAALHDESGAPVFSLPLETAVANGVRSARFMSGPHANGNFAPTAAAAPPIGAEMLSRLTDRLARQRPDIDLVLLERQAPLIDGRDNPLLALPHSASPNPALAVTLDGGFDAVLARTSGKRKRKKHRSQRRKFEAMGGWRRFSADTPDEVSMLLDAFFAMKQARFRQLGIRNTFEADGVQPFFRRLFVEALAEPRPPFVLHGLEVGGKVRAVTGSSVSGDRLVCEFSSFADDDTAHASPGDFLFFENIREACADGLAVYDFSVGDEAYKRLWCDRVETQFDCAIPLSAKGRLAAIAYRATGGAKRVLKSNEALWQAAKKLRRSVAGD